MQKACENVVCDIYGNSLDPDQEAVVTLGTIQLRPESFVFWCISLSGILQAVVFCGIGPIADYSHYRKRMFTVSSTLGGFGVCLYFFCEHAWMWIWTGALLAILNVLYGLSTIAYNAYLPILVESHTRIAAEADKIREEEGCVIEGDLKDAYDDLTNEVSQKGFGIGYIGTLISVIITMVLLIVFSEKNYIMTPAGAGSSQVDDPTKYVEQLFFSKVTGVEMIWSSETVKAFEFEYGDTSFDPYTRMFINGILDPFDSNDVLLAENGICSVDTWNSESRISAIRFNEKNEDEGQVYGNRSAHGENAISTHNGPQLAGWRAKKGESGDVRMNDLAFLWIDPKAEVPFNTFGYRLSILISGLWWLIFASFPIYYLKPRPGPDFPEGENWCTFGFKQVYRTVSRAKKNQNIFYYLICWFLFSDGLNTFSAACVIFAKKEMGLANKDIALLLIISLFGAFLGNALFTWIAKKWNIRHKLMLIFHLVSMGMLPIWILIGMIPGVPIGLVHKWEFYVLVSIFGLNVGSLQSYARTVYALLIPIGKETEFYALFEITNKGSSWLGTAIVAIVSNIASMRWSLVYIFLFFAIPIPILMMKVRIPEGARTSAKRRGSVMPRQVTLTMDNSIRQSRAHSVWSMVDRVELAVLESSGDEPLATLTESSAELDVSEQKSMAN